MEASEDGVEKWAKHRIHSSLSQRQLHEVCNCVSVCSVQRYLSLLIGILSILWLSNIKCIRSAYWRIYTHALARNRWTARVEEKIWASARRYTSTWEKECALNIHLCLSPCSRQLLKVETYLEVRKLSKESMYHEDTGHFVWKGNWKGSWISCKREKKIARSFFGSQCLSDHRSNHLETIPTQLFLLHVRLLRLRPHLHLHLPYQYFLCDRKVQAIRYSFMYCQNCSEDKFGKLRTPTVEKNDYLTPSFFILIFKE